MPPAFWWWEAENLRLIFHHIDWIQSTTVVAANENQAFVHSINISVLLMHRFYHWNAAYRDQIRTLIRSKKAAIPARNRRKNDQNKPHKAAIPARKRRKKWSKTAGKSGPYSPKMQEKSGQIERIQAFFISFLIIIKQ